MERTLRIDILGTLWMGGKAATTLHLDIGTGPFQTDIDDPTDPDDVESWLDRNTPDFASIIGWDATYAEKEVARHAQCEDPDRPGVLVQSFTTIVRQTHVHAFTEEQWCDWGDCFPDAD